MRRGIYLVAKQKDVNNYVYQFIKCFRSSQILWLGEWLVDWLAGSAMQRNAACSLCAKQINTESNCNLCLPIILRFFLVVCAHWRSGSGVSVGYWTKCHTHTDTQTVQWQNKSCKFENEKKKNVFTQFFDFWFRLRLQLSRALETVGAERNAIKLIDIKMHATDETQPILRTTSASGRPADSDHESRENKKSK